MNGLRDLLRNALARVVAGETRGITLEAFVHCTLCCMRVAFTIMATSKMVSVRGACHEKNFIKQLEGSSQAALLPWNRCTWIDGQYHQQNTVAENLMVHGV